MVNHPATGKKYRWTPRGACTLALALFLCASSQAQQDRPPQDQPPVQPQVQPQDQQASPVPPSQGSDRPPNTQDQRTPNAPGGQYRPVQSALTIPAGTPVLIRINEFLSSDRSQVGEEFTGVLQQPIVVNGWVVARRGQVVTGHVKAAQKAGRIKGVSQLGVELTDLTLVDGQRVPILTELWKASGGNSHGQDAATIGGGTVLGGLIGAAADYGKGAAIGAGAGAAAGIAAVLLTRGRPTVLEPETQLSFRLVDPVKVDTSQSQQAFLPVTQQDFETGQGERRPPRRLVAGYSGPGAYPCGYYGPCYFYPGYVGFYDGFGWDRSDFGGRRGFRH